MLAKCLERSSINNLGGLFALGVCAVTVALVAVPLLLVMDTIGEAQAKLDALEKSQEEEWGCFIGNDSLGG